MGARLSVGRTPPGAHLTRTHGGAQQRAASRLPDQQSRPSQPTGASGTTMAAGRPSPFIGLQPLLGRVEPNAPRARAVRSRRRLPRSPEIGPDSWVPGRRVPGPWKVSARGPFPPPTWLSSDGGSTLRRPGSCMKRSSTRRIGGCPLGPVNSNQEWRLRVRPDSVLLKPWLDSAVSAVELLVGSDGPARDHHSGVRRSSDTSRGGSSAGQASLGHDLGAALRDWVDEGHW